MGVADATGVVGRSVGVADAPGSAVNVADGSAVADGPGKAVNVAEGIGAFVAVGVAGGGVVVAVGVAVVSVAVSIFCRVATRLDKSVALQPKSPDDHARDGARTQRKRAATLSGFGHIEFLQHAIRAIPSWPVVYWWSLDLIEIYGALPKLAECAPAKFGLITSDNT